MFKKILLVAMMMIGVGCNEVTAPEETKDQTIQTVRKVTISDTVLVKKKIISGKIIEKNTSGKNLGGFPAIVCSDAKKTCVETNGSGEYFMSFESPIQKISARMMKTEDSTFDTIPNSKIDTIVDTVAKVDKIDSTKKDTVKITYRKYVPQSEPDTVIVFKDSKKIYETPITSWLNILPDNYIVQRNISGKIIQNSYVNELKDVEAVFWSLDSIAMVIPLEINGENYSGFIYQHYNDSSFRRSIRMFNMFVRILDKSDSVYGLTPVVNYSERSGDLVFSDIIPGNIARYPRPNYFRVIKEGSDVSILIDSVQKVSTNKKWYAMDSLFVRPMYKDTVKYYEDSTHNRYNYYLTQNCKNVVDSLIDSIGFYVELKEPGNIKIQSVVDSWDETYTTTDRIFIVKPKAFFTDNMVKFSEAEFILDGRVKKFQIYLHLK